MTLTSVVLSLTLVAVQLTMGPFSPRIVRAILHDPRSQLAVGPRSRAERPAMRTADRLDPAGEQHHRQRRPSSIRSRT